MASIPAASDICEGRVIAGKYQLVRPLARGGMGAVWVAKHLQLDSQVAIKFMTEQAAASPDHALPLDRVAKAAGIGKAGDATSSGVIVGSPRYLSPEQARHSRSVDHRTDLWSLGVIAYRSLTGRMPFEGDDLGDLIVKICTEPAKPVTAH